MRHFAIVEAVLVFSGCYVHSPLCEPTPAPGTEVEVTLTRAYSTGTTTALGSDIHVLDGRVLRGGQDTLALSVNRALNFDGSSTQKWHGDRIALPRTAIASVERRRLSVLRSGLLVGGVVIGAIVVAEAIRRQPPQCNYGATCAVPQ